MATQEILIGRDAESNKLKITVAGRSALQADVPMSVSREHCVIYKNDDGTAAITNLNPRNVTYVNGIPVAQKEISADDVVELGGERFRLDTSFLKLPRLISVSHLKQVWDSFEREQERARAKMVRKNALKGLSGLLTMAAIVISFIDMGLEAGSVNTIRIALYVVAALAVVLTFGPDAINPGKAIKEEKKRKDKFQQAYVCPQCGYFFGFTNSYDILLRTGECVKCKAKFRKS